MDLLLLTDWLMTALDWIVDKVLAVLQLDALVEQVCSATVVYKVLVCSLQLCMHVVAVTTVDVGLLVTQC
jgi:hypothetical protein